MKTKILSPRFIFVGTALLVAAFSRLLPHLPNVTPVAAMALFGGAYLSNKRLAVVLPLLAMLLSDGLMQLINGQGFHNTMLYVYAGFVLTSFTKRK